METLDIQELILSKLNTLIVVLNHQGQIEYVSKSAHELLGYNPNELLGNNWWEATRFSRPEGMQVKTKLMELFSNKSQQVGYFEHKLKTSSGAAKWFGWNVSALSDEHLVGVGMDITEKKRKEQELLDINRLLLEKNKEITDSIRYAQRIQNNILQSKAYINKIFPKHFVLYKPKDLVSGDFYFFHEDEQNRFAISVDCTGHGVPGAMMSMLANSIIKDILLNKKIKSPAAILYEIDRELFRSLNAYGYEINNDGMDAGIAVINKNTGRLHYAGALRPAILVRNNSLVELKANKYPLGFFRDIHKIFEEQVLLLQQGDNLFLFSDGYADQFGGEQNRKLNKKNFKELLLSVANMESEEQEGYLEYAFANWKQQHEQTDDVLVIGIKI